MSYRPKHLDRPKVPLKPTPDSQRSGEQTARRNRNVSFTGMVHPGACYKESSSTQAIIERLQKHIEYLQKKLTAAEADVNRLADLVHDLQHRSTARESELTSLAQRLAQEQKFTEELLKKYEGEQRAGRLSGGQQERSNSPDAEAREQHRLKCKPGKFSSAFLPTGFNSPNRVKGHKAEAFGGLFKDSSCRHLHENDGRVGNLYNQDLMREWKKEKREKAARAREAEELTAKNEILLKQVSSQKSLLTTLKHEASRASLRLNQEVSKLRKQGRFNSKHRERLIEQLRLSEEQVSYLMQYAPDEDDTFTTFDLKGLVERESSELLLESGLSEFAFRPGGKQDSGAQTEEVQSGRAQMADLQLRIKQLEGELQQSIIDGKQLRVRHNQQCQEYETAIELYKLRMEQLDHTIEMNQSRDHSKEETKHQGTQCQIVPSYVCEERQQILEKVKLLLEVNESIKHQVEAQKSTSQQLRQQISDIEAAKQQRTDQAVQVELPSPTGSPKRHRLYSFGEGESVAECEACLQLSSRVASLQEERSHFSNKYEETLTALQYQQEDAEAEVAKMHEAITEKDVRLRRVVEEAEREQAEQRELVGLLRGRIATLEGFEDKWGEIGSVFDQ